MSSALLNSPEPEAIDVEAEFQRLAEWWHRETGIHSDLTRKYEHPAFRQIVSLGPPVIPVLLREVQVRRRWLIGALWDLTGADPVPPEHVGFLDRMVADWTAWGRQNGYIE
jgi:hypothetical protein